MDKHGFSFPKDTDSAKLVFIVGAINIFVVE